MRKTSVAKLNAASEYRVEVIFIRMNLEMQCYEIGSGFPLLIPVLWLHAITENFIKNIFDHDLKYEGTYNRKPGATMNELLKH